MNLVPGRLPAFDPSKNACFDPHVVVLGAGASLAACPDGDAHGNRLPLMDDFVETVGVADLLTSAGLSWQGRNFEEVFSELYRRDGRSGSVLELEGAIYDYFAALRLPGETTLYDELILSLRDKDLIATFNWDPFLLQAFRRNRDVRRLPRLIFLHGNVEVGACVEHQRKGSNGTRCDECGSVFEPVPLLYPVTEKNYQDPFIEAEWAEFSAFLARAYLVTIFGYSAPAADVEAQRIMREVWHSNRTKELVQIDIIDLKPKEELKRTWEPFFVRDHYGISRSLDHSRLFAHPRRSCDSFAMASLQLRPCDENPLPRGAPLQELHAFVRPLVAEEDALDEDGAAFAC